MEDDIEKSADPRTRKTAKNNASLMQISQYYNFFIVILNVKNERSANFSKKLYGEIDLMQTEIYKITANDKFVKALITFLIFVSIEN